MVAVPARIGLHFVVQDNRGFKANVEVLAYDADVSTDATTIGGLYTNTANVGTAIGNMTNAKVVETGFSFSWAFAQEPSSETGTYELVIQKARLNFGDGHITRNHLSIPAPKDALFLTGSQDNLIVINPSGSLLTALQSAAGGLVSPSGGTILSQFFGGQLVEGKPRRRRVLQGA